MGLEQPVKPEETKGSDNATVPLDAGLTGVVDETNHKKTAGEWLKDPAVDWPALIERKWLRGNNYWRNEEPFIKKGDSRVRPVLGEFDGDDRALISQAFGFLSSSLRSLYQSKLLTEMPVDIISHSLDLLEKWNPNPRSDREAHVEKLNRFIERKCALIDPKYAYVDFVRGSFAFDSNVFKQKQFDELMEILELPKVAE